MITSKTMSKKENESKKNHSVFRSQCRNSGANEDPINRTVNGLEQNAAHTLGRCGFRKEIRIHSSALYHIVASRVTRQPWPSGMPPDRTWGPRDR